MSVVGCQWQMEGHQHGDWKTPSKLSREHQKLTAKRKSVNVASLRHRQPGNCFSVLKYPSQVSHPEAMERYTSF